MDEVHYCNDPVDVRAVAGVRESLVRLRESGWARVIITNQSGISRGRITLGQYEAVHAELLRQLGGEIDGAYFSADLPGSDSPRRKPGTAMLLEAARELHLDLGRAYFVGDKMADVDCGRAAGIPSVLVLTGHGAKESGSGAHFVAPDVNGAIQWILTREGVTA